MGYITMCENNSGGSFWLTEKNYEDLLALGWEGKGPDSNDRYKDRVLINRVLSRRMALAQFEDVTGYSPDEEGCECCGQPFYFAEYDDEGKSVW
jgi:hypothetical protein